MVDVSVVYARVFIVVLLHDLVHDEVFIEGTGLVVMVCGRWLYSWRELRFVCLCECMGLVWER